jgi:hypothetical protein
VVRGYSEDVSRRARSSVLESETTARRGRARILPAV